MMKELHFASYAIKKNIQNSSELRASFLMNIIGMAISNISFIIIWIFFVKSVGIINGWTAADIIGLLGFGTLSYGIVFSVAYGIKRLPDYVAMGVFDIFMLSPKNLLIRIATSSFSVSAIGDIFFGIASLVIYGLLININIVQVFFLIFLVLIATLIFLSVAIVVYSASFLFTDANSITTGLFELFLAPSLFHGGAFQGAMRFVFTFVIPSLVLGTLPVEILKNMSLEQLAIVGLITIAWFLLSLKLFSMGVKKYESANFMTFGN